MNEWYENFLSSDEWRIFRRKYLKDHPKCSLCGKRAVNLHHVRYPPDIWDIDRRDIMPLCRECHVMIHEEISEGVIEHPRNVTTRTRTRIKRKMLRLFSKWSCKAIRVSDGKIKQPKKKKNTPKTKKAKRRQRNKAKKKRKSQKSYEALMDRGRL